MSIPNLISIVRLLLVPVIIWLMLDGVYTVAFWLCMVAGVSDALDGFIAKNFNQATTLGAYLDPLADKALLVSVYITLGMQEHIAGWLAILVVSRDMLIIGAVVLSYLINRPQVIKPLLTSKANTFAQITLGVVVIAHLGLDLEINLVDAIQSLTIVVAVTTITSGALYMRNWIRSMSNWESGTTDSN